MKKLTLIIAMTIIGLTSFAQLTLLHTFDAYVYNTFSSPVNDLPDNKYYYTQQENGTAKYYIYDADFSLDDLYAITPVNIPDGYILASCQFLSNRNINNDDDYEWLVLVYNNSADASIRYYAYIENSQGDIIYNFGYNAYIYNMSFHIASNQLRASVTKLNYDSNNTAYYSTEIYSCGGNITRTTESKKEKIQDAYPNPATSFVNLPYELNNGETSTMNIYDINGRLIEQKPIGYHFKNLELNVSNYNAGTYIYEYNGKSNRFVVQ